MLYTIKPKTVEAVQYLETVQSVKDIIDLLGFVPEIVQGYKTEQKMLRIKIGYSLRIVTVGDYIVKEDDGSIDVWSAEAFEVTFGY